MPGRLAAAPDFDQWRGEVLRIPQAGAVGGAADGEDGIVLKEEEGVGGFPCEVAGDDFLLQGQAGGIVDPSQPTDGGSIKQCGGTGREGRAKRHFEEQTVRPAGCNGKRSVFKSWFDLSGAGRGWAKCVPSIRLHGAASRLDSAKTNII